MRLDLAPLAVLVLIAAAPATVAPAEAPPRPAPAPAAWEGRDLGGGIALAPDGATVAVGAGDGTVRVLSAADGRPARAGSFGPADERFSRFRIGPGPVRFSPDGATLVAGNFLTPIGLRDVRRVGPDALRAWDFASGRVLYTLDLAGDARTFVVAGDGRTLVASVALAGGRDVLRAWDLRSGTPAGTADLPSRGTTVTAFAPDGTRLASGRPGDPAILLHEVPSGRVRETLSAPASRGPLGLAFSPDGGTLAALREGNVVQLWDVPSASLRATIDPPADDSKRHAFAMAFSPDGRRLVLAGGRVPGPAATGLIPGRAILVDVASGIRTGAVEGMAPSAHDLAVSPDGRRLIVSGTEFGGGTVPMESTAAWSLPPGR